MGVTRLPFAINSGFERVLGEGGIYIHTLTPHGPSGLGMSFKNRNGEPGSIFVTQSDYPGINDDTEYLHASIAYNDEDQMPSYEDLALLHHAVFGRKRWSYQVFAPLLDHISIRDNALHLWGRADGKPMLPDFGYKGTI